MDSGRKDLLTYDAHDWTYYARHKLTNGQYCMIAFQKNGEHVLEAIEITD